MLQKCLISNLKKYNFQDMAKKTHQVLEKLIEEKLETENEDETENEEDFNEQQKVNQGCHEK